MNLWISVGNKQMNKLFQLKMLGAMVGPIERQKT